MSSLTHEVTNQAPPRIDVNEYTENPLLRDAVATFGGAWADAHLVETGAHVGSAAFIADARTANTNPPALHTHDRWGHRIDQVEYDESYHRVIAAAIARGAHTSAWANPVPGANVARAATFMLFSQVEPGHACPVSMTHAAVASLKNTPAVADAWLPRLYATSYDPRLLPASEKPNALIGMAMTEKQGGSDVRANRTIATHVENGMYSLTGHKWFCSAPMSDGFLVLAQARHGENEAGLSCFFVPRVLDDGTYNTFRIQRLKDKLGNKSNASSEIEFDDTIGFLLGEPGRGVRTIIDMVQRTRLDCVLGSAAGMRQSVAEALWHARSREAFGARLVDQPAMTAVLADLALESQAAMLTGLRLAQAFEADASDHDQAFARLATPVSKYWVCKRGPNHSYEAMECLGGNGYTEAFPLAMRYREQPVMAIWEGTGNVIALDVLRALGREPDATEAFASELETTRGANQTLDAHTAHTLKLLTQLARADAIEAQTQARQLTESLALALQGSLMVRHAAASDADAFIAARLGDERSSQYGVLPRGTDAAAIVARH